MSGFLGQDAEQLFATEERVLENAHILTERILGYLEHKGFKRALACFEIMMSYRDGDGVRKDGKTPKWLHELTQAVYTVSMIEEGLHLENPENIICLNFIHDLGEDYNVSPIILHYNLLSRGIPDDKNLSDLIYDFITISKKFGKDSSPRHVTNKEYGYYEENKISQDASLAKLIDRTHNLATLVGISKPSKVTKYAGNTAVIVNDYARDASHLFPSQTEAYEALNKIIRAQVQMSLYPLAWQKLGKELPPDQEILDERMPERGFNLPSGLHPLLMMSARIRKICCHESEPHQDITRERFPSP